MGAVWAERFTYGSERDLGGSSLGLLTVYSCLKYFDEEEKEEIKEETEKKETEKEELDDL